MALSSVQLKKEENFLIIKIMKQRKKQLYIGEALPLRGSLCSSGKRFFRISPNSQTYRENHHHSRLRRTTTVLIERESIKNNITNGERRITKRRCD